MLKPLMSVYLWKQFSVSELGLSESDPDESSDSSEPGLPDSPELPDLKALAESLRR